MKSLMSNLKFLGTIQVLSHPTSRTSPILVISTTFFELRTWPVTVTTQSIPSHQILSWVRSSPPALRWWAPWFTSVLHGTRCPWETYNSERLVQTWHLTFQNPQEKEINISPCFLSSFLPPSLPHFLFFSTLVLHFGESRGKPVCSAQKERYRICQNKCINCFLFKTKNF